MSKYTNSFLWLALFLPILGMAQIESTPTQKSYAPTAAENSLLWEISGNDLSEPSYLFGTIHMIGKDDFILTDATKDAFEKCNKVVFEINMEEMNDITAMLPLLMKSFMEGGKTLRDILNEEDYKIVSDHFNKIGLPLALLERVKPMFLTVMASEDMGQGGGGMEMGNMKSYELELAEMAKVGKKEVGGLETAAYQMSMFDSIPYEVQGEMLVESIKSGSSGADSFDEMVEMYKKQDLFGLQTLIAQDGSLHGYDDLLLNQRNRNWIAPMEVMMAVQPTFFAVGAGHLAGEQGVISLLRQEGYTVKPVK
jgi:uncharacterized protein YbaP (TraB family)